MSVANLRLSQAEEEEIIGFLKLGMNTTSVSELLNFINFI